MDVEARSGVVETFDCSKGYGCIEMEDGERALLHITCLRGCGYREASEGRQCRVSGIARLRRLASVSHSRSDAAR